MTGPIAPPVVATRALYSWCLQTDFGGPGAATAADVDAAATQFVAAGPAKVWVIALGAAGYTPDALDRALDHLRALKTSAGLERLALVTSDAAARARIGWLGRIGAAVPVYAFATREEAVRWLRAGCPG